MIFFFFGDFMKGVKYKNLEQRMAFFSVHKWLREKLIRIGLQLVVHFGKDDELYLTIEGFPEKPDSESWTRYSCNCGREYNELAAIFESIKSEKHFEGKPRSRWH
jgi:hypothetical protein